MKPYFAFQWHITDYCDQRCKHCYIFSEGKYSELLSMDMDCMKKVIANIEDMCEKLNRTPYFYITGGDPILHPDFWKLMALIQSKGYKFTILGNPFHLTDEVCRRLKECGCEKYQLSLDGLRDTHDYFRKPGSFDCTLEKIAVIRNAGIKCAIMSTVSGTNMEEMPDVVDLAVKHKADIFAFGRYCPTGEDKDVNISPLAYRDFLDKMWHKYETCKAQGVNTYFNLRTTCGLCTYMKKGYLKSRHTLKRIWSMRVATAGSVI